MTDCNNNETNLLESENKNKKTDFKKNLLIGGCAIALGIGGVAIYNQSNHQEEEVIDKTFEDFPINNTPVTLDFTNKSADEMKNYYTLEGEEYIKKIYPDSVDSEFALLTVGKSIEKELSHVNLKTLNNEEISLKDLKGKRIIIDFALRDCGNCQDEFEFISKKEKSENEVFLHIFPNDSTQEIKNTFNEFNLQINEEHTISLTGMNNLTFSDFSVTHVPSKIYINEDGIVSYVTTDVISTQELYELHYNRAFGEGEKMLDFLKNE